MRIINAKVFDICEFSERDIYIKDGKISDASDDDNVFDASGYFAIPGLVDIHFHGAVGCDFCDSDIESIARLAKYEASKGVMAICPATMTFPEEKLIHIATTAKNYVRKYKNDKEYAELVGINLEGPFISSEKNGAQNPEYIVAADGRLIDKLQKASGNLIKLIDIAPECFNNLNFIADYSDKVSISLAHTNCDYDTAIAAFDRGANHMTHLFNAMPKLDHRKPGPIVAAMEKGAYAELITDGIHIHPAMVRLAFLMFGDEKTILISDSMRACGLKDGKYDLGGQNVNVSGRLATMENDSTTIAGSVTNLFDCMRIAIKEMGIPPISAIRAATYNPAKSIGIDNNYGSFLPGRKGIVLLVNSDFEFVRIISS